MKPEPVGPVTVREIVDDVILSGAGDHHVVVGPVCWAYVPGSTTEQFTYFIVSTCYPDRTCRHAHCNGDESDRAAILEELARRKGLVVHDVNDELRLVKLCEVLWPGEEITQLRETVEADRAQRAEWGMKNKEERP
jgi:hypothetical protein